MIIRNYLERNLVLFNQKILYSSLLNFNILNMMEKEKIFFEDNSYWGRAFSKMVSEAEAFSSIKDVQDFLKRKENPFI